MAKKKTIELPDKIKKRLDEETKYYISYQKFLNSIKDCKAEVKARKWLEYIADNIRGYGDQEALVYLVSQGYDCLSQISELIQDWKYAARKTIKQCAEGGDFYDLTTSERKKIGSMTLAEASDIKNLSSIILRNFWGYSDSQELTIDATMLRTVERCEVGGFNEWWERLAKEATEHIITSGVDPVPSSFWLFHMCRSDYAISLIHGALLRCLEAIEVSFDTQKYPWTILREKLIDNERKLVSADHIPYASTIVFANHRLPDHNHKNTLVESALEALLKHQDKNGAWRCWADSSKPGIESTAMAIHALMIAKPRGWHRAVSLSKDWLWSQQSENGYWSSASAPDDVYLTVLVLDTLELIDGGQNVTFTTKENIIAKQIDKKDSKRFKVALSFPSEVREIVEKIAHILAARLGKNRVFYDEFHQSELARPNLDIHLQKIYHDESKLIVIFLSSEYEKKEWCGLEWRAIRDLIKKRKDEDIMPLRLDDTIIPGLFSIDGYIDIRNKNAEEIADLIFQRAGR